MGLCKCRNVTNLFCFEHRKNVCEKCIVTDHVSCVVRSYLQWLQDSDFDASCGFCRQPLQPASSPLIRLPCLDVFHVDCVNKHCMNLPEHTTGNGYACILCNTPIMPPESTASPVGLNVLKTFQNAPWTKRIAFKTAATIGSHPNPSSSQLRPVQTTIPIPPRRSASANNGSVDVDDDKYGLHKDDHSQTCFFIFGSRLRRRVSFKSAVLLLGAFLTMMFLLSKMTNQHQQ